MIMIIRYWQIIAFWHLLYCFCVCSYKLLCLGSDSRVQIIRSYIQTTASSRLGVIHSECTLYMPLRDIVCCLSCNIHV